MKNVGILDRILRFVLGVFLILLGYLYLVGIWQLMSYIIGIILIITGIFGRCYLYKSLGIDTHKIHKIKEVKNI